MRAADASTRPSFAEFQRQRHARSPGNLSATTGSVKSGDCDDEEDTDGRMLADASASRARGGGRSASATLQRSPGRVKVLWEDPSATSRSRSAGRNSNQQRRTGKKSATPPKRDTGGKRSPRPNKQAARSPSRQAGLPQAARVLVQRVMEWDARLKAAASSSAAETAAFNPLAELDSGAVSLQSAFRMACADLLTSYPEAATKMDVDRRLWQNWYRYLDCVQRLDSLSARETLDECSRFYLDLVARLESKSKNANVSAECREAVQFSLQHSLVALGDVERYKQQYLASAFDPASSAQSWVKAIEFYQSARAIAPTNGKVYNQLALVAVRDKKFLEAAYLYARSLGCQHPFPSRVNLVQSLKKGALMSPSTNMFAKPSDRGVGMRISGILGKLYALLARTADGNSWRDNLPSVQPIMRVLLSVEDLLNDKEYRDQVATAIVQIVSVNLLVVYDAQSGSDPVAITQGKLELDTSNQIAVCALELLYTLGASILQQLTEFLRATSDYRQLQNVADALLPGLNALLQWLHSQKWLSEARSEAAELFYASYVKFHFALPSSAFAMYFVGLATTRDQELPEDRETKGFLPLDVARERYASSFPATPARSASPKNKTRNAQGRAGSPSLNDKMFEVRMARVVALCRQLTRSGGKPDQSARPGALSRNKKSAGIDRLCSQCSNSSTFDGGACEFCGFEDETLETSADSDDDGDDEIVLTAQYLRDVNLANEATRSLNDSLYGSSSSGVSGYYSSEVSGPQQPPSSPDPSSFAAVMAIGSKYSEFQSGFQLSQARGKCLIVIDAPNVAMRHGMNRQFSSLGVRLAADYFRALGHRVVAFIPDYMLKNEKEQLAARRKQPRSANATLNDGGSNVSKIPDDIEMLRAMVQEGVLVPTPPQDYDDSYCIQYAGLHDGCVVTNDLFRDHIQNMEGPRERKEAMRTWLKAHQISFTWVQNEFLPNPNFRFPA